MSRLHGLDGLRGLAALLVFVQHLLYILSERGHAWAGSIVYTVDLGQFGVSLFFLISGFVIPFSFRDNFAGFWVGRAFRLLPALWLSILFCLALGERLDSGTQLFANAFMLLHLTEQRLISGPYWTLQYEMDFYAIMALAFAFGWLRKPSTFGLLAIAFGLVSMFNPWFSYLIFMFTGALLRMVLIERDEPARLWLYAAIGTLAVLYILWARFGSRPPQVYIGLALALPTFLLLWKRVTHPALIWLGAVSYSLYLFHLPILEALAPLPTPAFAILGISLPMLVAAAVYRCVERPMMGKGKAISNRLRGQATTTSDAGYCAGSSGLRSG